MTLRTLWRRTGRLLFWPAWPGIWLVVKLSPARTRLAIVCNNELLLVKDWLGTGEWKLPGGGLHHGEPAKAGALRELKEEVGIDLSAGQLVPSSSFRIVSNHISVQIIAFQVKLNTKPNIKTQVEITDAVWVPTDKLKDYRLSVTTRKVIAGFIDS